MANRIVHFEIEALDKERAKKFYSQAFGWQMDQMGDEYGSYVVIKTGEQNEMGINGGMFQGGPQKELNAYSCTIGVNDIQKAITDIRAAGGKVFEHNMDDKGNDMGEVMDIPHVGKYAKCEDTEGNRFTLLQPSPDMTAQK